jgi:hypothetical protein
MNDNTVRWLSLVAVGTLVVLILVLTFTEPGQLQAADENITGPPPDPFLPPLWVIPVAGVLAATIGLGIALIQTND